MTSPGARADVVIVGGGLAGGLAALAYAERQPELHVRLVEAAPALGGNHLWSFHETDVPDEARALVEPLVSARWPSYDVAFPELRREVGLGYASVHSPRLDGALRGRCGASIVRGRAVAIDAHSVTLDDGRTLEAALVLDARGPEARPGEIAGYQKFVGLELALLDPAPALRATIMDATVEQHDGMRFVYTLPFTPTHVLVEDTVLADGPALDRELYRRRVLAHAAALGLSVSHVVREEHGVLPLPLAGAGPSVDAGAPLVIGYQGGWFHPTTGYSFPLAVRLAWALAGLAPDAALAPGSPVHALAAEVADSARFARLLNRLLFRATPPAERWRVLERFHRLPDETIAHFYRLHIRRRDRVRIVCGRPPRGVSWRAAVSQLADDSAAPAARESR